VVVTVVIVVIVVIAVIAATATAMEAVDLAAEGKCFIPMSSLSLIRADVEELGS
jgi:hypothetical protein